MNALNHQLSVEQKVNTNEIIALLKLLDDPNEEVITAVTQKIFEIGPDIVPQLEKIWETSINTQFQERLENLIQEIQFQNVCQDLRNWDLMGGSDILRGATIIARFQYPEIEYHTLLNSIAEIKDTVWVEMNDNLTPLEKIKVINHVFYEVHKFTGNFSNYYAPQNYYLNQVLETHKGNPISLGIIYISLARMFGLPVYGINLPKNFILAYKDELATNKQDSIQFYINPYNKGAVLGKREIDYFLDQQKITPNDIFYYPCSNLDIIERLIRNLISSYESLGQLEKVQRFGKLLKIINR